jgi:phage gp29-like protein
MAAPKRKPVPPPVKPKPKAKRKAQLANAQQPDPYAAKRPGAGKAVGTTVTPVASDSDSGPQNPLLLSQHRRPGQPNPPTMSQIPVPLGAPGEEGIDYFRMPPKQIEGDADLRQQPIETITPARVWQSVRMRWNPIRGLTFERLVKYLDEFWYGYYRQCTMTWQQMMRRDYQLRIDAPKRFKSVARHGWEIALIADLADDDKPAAEAQKEFLEDFYNNITTIDALNADHQGGMSLLLRQMMHSMAYYYAIHEIVWQPKDDGSLTAQFIHCPIWWFEGVRGKLRYLQSEFQVWGEEMRPAEWLITVGDGLMECCSIIYMLKHGSLKSWVAYLDKFGMPGLLGKTHAKKGSPEWNAMKDALVEFAQEWATVIGGVAGDMKENDISLVEARNSENGAAFKNLLDTLDRAITQLWRGGDLSTSSQRHGVGANLQMDESEIHETDDAKVLEETLHDQVTKFALQWKFGAYVKSLAYISLRTTPKTDFQNDIATDTFLVNNGFPLSIMDCGERYNRTPAKPGEPALIPMQLTLAGQQQQHEAGMAQGQQDHAADMQQQKFDSMGRLQQAGSGYAEGYQNGHAAGRGPAAPQPASATPPANGDARAPNPQPGGGLPGFQGPGFFDLARQGGGRPPSGAQHTTGYYFPTNQAMFAQDRRFNRAAQTALQAAYKSDLQPLMDKLHAIWNIADPDHRRARLAAFLNEIEKMRKDLQQDSEASSALQKILSSALANGLTQARRNGKAPARTKNA